MRISYSKDKHIDPHLPEASTKRVSPGEMNFPISCNMKHGVKTNPEVYHSASKQASHFPSRKQEPKRYGGGGTTLQSNSSERVC